ncbi:MAG: hypothetical protein JWO10_5 [Microbacteriaceae bacterium]|nr:hypothetical protein [Microbacteriaceae bacterium]
MLVAGVLGSVAIGVLIAIQSRINGELGRALGDGYLAASLSFGSGFIVVAIAMVFWRPGRRGLAAVMTAVKTRAIPAWFICGGALGALFVLSQGLTGAVLGVALFTIAVVCGQTVSGLLIDRRGIGITPPKPLTITRLLGAVLALVAVGWAVSPHFGGDVPLWMLALPLIAGLGVGLQQAINGQVKLRAASALTPTFLNFLIGGALLLVAAAIHVGIVGWPASFPSNPLLYIGGLVGGVFVAATAMVVRITGLLLLGLASTAGQLVTSLVLDVVLPIPGHVFAFATVGGTALTLVAVLVAATPSRRISRERGL